MLLQDFNPTESLAASKCPRCGSLGLLEIDSDIYDAAPPEHRHQAAYHVDPSIPARCPACSLVMEWPGCCD